jgi:hypothetical protein
MAVLLEELDPEDATAALPELELEGSTQKDTPWIAVQLPLEQEDDGETSTASISKSDRLSSRANSEDVMATSVIGFPRRSLDGEGCTRQR